MNKEIRILDCNLDDETERKIVNEYIQKIHREKKKIEEKYIALREEYDSVIKENNTYKRCKLVSIALKITEIKRWILR